MIDPLCFDCVHFTPGGTRRNDLTEEQWDECLEGECHRHTPHLGPVFKDRDGDTYRHFGQWPRVMAGDWCGEFESRYKATRDSGARTPHVGPCSNISCGAEKGCARAGVCHHVAEQQSGQDGKTAAIGTPPPRAS